MGPIGSFDSVRQGQRVVAVGHPFEFPFSLTEGIVSAKREGLWLQTSAQINPGNSGGPLVDEEGRVLAVNTGTYRRDAQGLGFAIRADLVRQTESWVFAPDVSDLMRRIEW